MKKIFVLSLMFLTTGVFADAVIVNNFNGVCGNYGYDRLFASFTPISYTCSSGYYLPADALGCESCPSGYVCDGGTYAYNATKNQGLIQIATCSSGYFLPANATVCSSCPSEYTCSGGTYRFNERLAQGLVRNSDTITASANNVCAANFPRSLNASFTPNTINITWQKDDGTTLTTNTCTYGQPITIPEAPHKTGYRFTGWTVVNQ